VLVPVVPPSISKGTWQQVIDLLFNHTCTVSKLNMNLQVEHRLLPFMNLHALYLDMHLLHGLTHLATAMRCNDQCKWRGAGRE